MAELLIVLMMAFNLWMVIYLTWERREDNKAEDGKGKDCEMKGMPDDIVGKSRFRMAERKPQAATMKPNAATDAQSEDVDEKDVTFDWTRCLQTAACRTWQNMTRTRNMTVNPMRRED